MIRNLIKWFFISLAVAILAGAASAGFLFSLDVVTFWRESHVWIIAFLPFGGLFLGWIYHRYGKSVERGNDLLLEEIHDPKDTVPLRMAPLVLFGTLLTHFFGGSAGREGTAVQMGGSLADQLSGPLKLHAENRKILLMAGLSAGFSSIFGTPLAGAVFGLEVLSIGKLQYAAIFPCFIAAIFADLVTRGLGIRHTIYPISDLPDLTAVIVFKAMIAGTLFGLVGFAFARSVREISGFLKAKVSYPPLRPFIGGVVVASAVWIIGTTQFIGLGIPTIIQSFQTPMEVWIFAAKFAFTVVTLGAGFKGGEVTPLFFIGATLGNAMAPVLGLPVPLLAGMGFVAVFAGAANAPLASTLVAIEMFGAKVGAPAGIACVMSYLFSGHAGIYHSQRLGITKEMT